MIKIGERVVKDLVTAGTFVLSLSFSLSFYYYHHYYYSCHYGRRHRKQRQRLVINVLVPSADSCYSYFSALSVIVGLTSLFGGRVGFSEPDSVPDEPQETKNSVPHKKKST